MNDIIIDVISTSSQNSPEPCDFGFMILVVVMAIVIFLVCGFGFSRG